MEGSLYSKYSDDPILYMYIKQIKKFKEFDKKVYVNSKIGQYYYIINPYEELISSLEECMIRYYKYKK